MNYKTLFFSFLLLAAWIPHCVAQGDTNAAKDSLLRLIAHASSDTFKVNMLVELTWVLNQAGADEELEYAEQALALSKASPWQKGMALSYCALGSFHFRKGDIRVAERDYLTSLNMHRGIQDPAFEKSVRENLALTYTALGNRPELYRQRREVIVLAQRMGDRKAESNAWLLLGQDYAEENLLDSAIANWKHAAQLKLQTGDTSNLILFSNLGLAYSMRKEFVNALYFFHKALAFAISRRESDWQAQTLLQIGRIYWTQYDYFRAVAFFERAEVLQWMQGHASDIAIIENNLGSIYQDKGDYNASLQHFLLSLRISELLKDGLLLATNLNDLTTTYNAAGENRKAVLLLKKALHLFTARGDIAALPTLEGNLGVVYTALDSPAVAAPYFQRALAALERKHYWFQAAKIRIDCADASYRLGQYSRVLQLLYRALPCCVDSNDVVAQSKCFGGIGRAYWALFRQDRHMNLPDSLSRYTQTQFRHKAVAALKQAVALARATGNINELPEYYRLLSEAQEASGDSPGALASHKSYLLYRDSLMSAEKVRALTQRDLQYDFDKTQAAEKAAHDQALAVEAERRRSGIRLAMLSGGGLLVLFITGFYFQRRRSQDRHAAQVLTLKQEALNAQMSDHFIGNTMDSINGFMVANDRENASRYLILFSRLIRRVLENASCRLVTVAEDLDVLRDYLALERLRFEGDLQCEIQNPDDLDLEALLIPPMIFQTLAENAIKHGFRKTASGILTIRLRQDGNRLECSLEDNGVGRAAAQTPAQRKSFGTGIAEKLVLASGPLSGASRFEVTDLRNAVNKPAGTRVTFLLPLLF